MRWDVFRQTPTEEVWAVVERGIEAEDARTAVAVATASLPHHLLGDYFAARSGCIEHFIVEDRTTQHRAIEVSDAVRNETDKGEWLVGSWIKRPLR